MTSIDNFTKVADKKVVAPSAEVIKASFLWLNSVPSGTTESVVLWMGYISCVYIWPILLYFKVIMKWKVSQVPLIPHEALIPIEVNMVFHYILVTPSHCLSQLSY